MFEYQKTNFTHGPLSDAAKDSVSYLTEDNHRETSKAIGQY